MFVKTCCRPGVTCYTQFGILSLMGQKLCVTDIFKGKKVNVSSYIAFLYIINFESIITSLLFLKKTVMFGQIVMLYSQETH